MPAPSDDIRLGYNSLLLLGLIASSPEGAYGVSLSHKLGKLMGRDIGGDKIYVMLHRLRDDGFIDAGVSRANPPGPPLKFYTLTQKGGNALKLLRKVING